MWCRFWGISACFQGQNSLFVFWTFWLSWFWPKIRVKAWLFWWTWKCDDFFKDWTYVIAKWSIHPRKLTCHLKRAHFKRKVVFQSSFLRAHVSFPFFLSKMKRRGYWPLICFIQPAILWLLPRIFSGVTSSFAVCVCIVRVYLFIYIDNF